MPAVWLSWSMLLFVATILSFVWRTGSVNDPNQWPGLSPTQILGPRIAVSAVLMLGLGYLVLIVRTLQRYSGPRYRRTYWRPGGTDGLGTPSGNATGVATAGSSSGRGRERGDGEQRGRERERVMRSNREQETDRQRKTHPEQDRYQDESDGKKDDYGKEKGPSGLRKTWGLGLTGEIEDNDAGAGTSDEAALEKENER